jgi:predicted transcriptional regulator
MNRDSWPVDRRAELARREVERRATVQRVELDPHPRRDDAPGGWAVLPSWIGCDPSLSPEARVVLLVLSAHSDDRAHPFPSIARIARLVGRSERTILRLLAELEGRGLIERLHRFRNGEQVSSAYALRFDRWGRHGRQGDGVSRVSDRGDTDDAPQGDTRGAPRGDTGGVQNNTKGPPPEGQDSTPPSPPAGAGGMTAGPVEVREARGDRMRRIAREEGLRLRDARRIVEREEVLATQPPIQKSASWEEELLDGRSEEDTAALMRELAELGHAPIRARRDYP